MLDVADKTRIAAQMGRVPRGVVAVAARCPAGHPCVVTSYPLRRTGVEVSPFPTLYWLTCPRLCARVSHLERDGVIADLEDELGRDEAFRAALLRDHEDYAARRWAMLSSEDQRLVAERGLVDDFRTRGIGGMASRTGVKCLHLHLAHHLAAGNAIGARLVARYDLKPCPVASINHERSCSDPEF